jgi:hypothetical protein
VYTAHYYQIHQNEVSDSYKCTSFLDCFLNNQNKTWYSRDSSLAHLIKAEAYLSDSTSKANNYRIQNEVSDCYKHTSLSDCFINSETKSCYNADSCIEVLVKVEAYLINSTLTVHKYQIW